MIVAYISGHGFGHAAREVSILRHLPASIGLTIVSTAPAWFFAAELGRPFELRADAFDVGCVQTDSLTVDIDATRDAWRLMEIRNRDRFADEAGWLKSVGARVVVADVASFPLTLAAALRISGVCVANFTWADIYAPYPGFDRIADRLRAQYACASQLLDTDLALSMDYFPHRENVGLVARVGRDRREQLLAAVGGQPPERLALVYPGVWGTPFLWERLTEFSGWRFVVLGECPERAPGNVVALARDMFRHEEIVASVDAVISKAGYGIVGECLANGTPLIYGPRAHFAEFAALDSALQGWPGGHRLAVEAFADADWSDALRSIPERGATPRLPAPGATAAAARIASLWQA